MKATIFPIKQIIAKACPSSLGSPADSHEPLLAQVPARGRALHGGMDAIEDDATHRITAGAMHAKKAARPVTPEDDAAKEDATHRLTAGTMHAKKPARPQRERHHEKHHIPQRTSHTGESSQESLAKERRTCRTQDLFSQSGSLPGDWVPHPDPGWQGLYVAHEQCPEFAMDFDCTVGTGEVYHRNRELAKTEFNKVFRPHKYAPAGFHFSQPSWRPFKTGIAGSLDLL